MTTPYTYDFIEELNKYAENIDAGDIQPTHDEKLKYVREALYKGLEQEPMKPVAGALCIYSNQNQPVGDNAMMFGGYKEVGGKIFPFDLNAFKRYERPRWDDQNHQEANKLINIIFNDESMNIEQMLELIDRLLKQYFTENPEKAAPNVMARRR